MDEMTSDFDAQRFELMQAVSEQVILPSTTQWPCLNKMMSDRHGQLPILGLTVIRLLRFAATCQLS